MQFVALNNFDDPLAAPCDCQCGARAAIACVGKHAFDEREQGARALVEDKGCAVAILDAGGMDSAGQKKAERIYENVPLLALDLFACIVAMRIDARPPFSALFTLWLSMMAAVGLASRSSRCRHST